MEIRRPQYNRVQVLRLHAAPSVCTFCLALCSPACSQFFVFRENLRSAFDNVALLRFLSFKQIYPEGYDDWMPYIKQYKTFEFQILSNSPLCPMHGHQHPFHLCLLKLAVVFLRFYLQSQEWFPVASKQQNWLVQKRNSSKGHGVKH